MGLTKKELSAKLNEAFDSIYGEWDESFTIDLSEYKFDKDGVDRVSDYRNEWVDWVNRHNMHYQCRVSLISRIDSYDNTDYLHLTCRWCEIDRMYVEFTYDDDSETELLSDK